MPALQQHGAFRVGPVAGARVVCRDRAAWSVVAHVWCLLAVSLLPVAHLAARVLPAHQDGDADGLLNFVLERDVADSIARVRTEPWGAAGDQQFRADGRR